MVPGTVLHIFKPCINVIKQSTNPRVHALGGSGWKALANGAWHRFVLVS